MPPPEIPVPGHERSLDKDRDGVMDDIAAHTVETQGRREEPVVTRKVCVLLDERTSEAVVLNAV